MNHKPPDVQAGFRKGRGARDQSVNIRWIIKKAREFQENIYFCFIDYAKAFVWITTNRKILQEAGIPDHLTCLLRNLYAVQEVTVRTGHGTTDCFQIGKGVCQGCILSPWLFNLYSEYIREGDGTPLQYSCLENPSDGGAWLAAVYGVAQSRTQLKRLSSRKVIPHHTQSTSANNFLKCSEFYP